MQATKRARSAEAKQLRLDHILTVSSALLEASSLNDFTVDAVATHAHLSKPALYNYFPTKEEILLELYRRHLRAWMERLSSEILATLSDMDRERFNRLFIDSFLEKPLLAKLTPHLAPTLEQNVTAKTYNAFKRETATLTESFAQLLVTVERANEETCHKIALAYMTALVGALHLSAPVPFSRGDLDKDVAEFTDQMNFRANCLNALQLIS